ncbi:MAG: TonB-dependent receptor, partial [Cyclobacteriaceae bacterium]
AESLFDGQGFINSTNWRDMHNTRGRNNPMVGRSIFDVGSRVTAFLTYRKEYAGVAATGITLFYNGQSGQPFSYVYNDNGDLTNEDSEERQMIYVPRNQSEIVFADQATAAAQWAALDAYIEGDDHLKDRRGAYAERNQSRTPFESVIDLKITQDFFINTPNGRRHTLQVSFDIFNFSNFINKNWGRRYFVGDDNFELLTFEGFALDTSGEETLQPTFSFNDPGDPYDILTSGINSGRWAAQFGVRYSF